MKQLFLILILGAFATLTTSQVVVEQSTKDPKEVLRKAEDKLRGLTSISEMKMTVVRPTWKREMKLKAWSKGEDYSLILVTAPARDKGTAFLKREKEIWNWQPSIDRVIKLPPSMMMQSWMGSDFTNDDLVKHSSTLEDYTHKLLDAEMIDDRDCYVLELIPREEAAVVWGKVILWIDKKDYMELRTELYDEEGYLVNTIHGKNIKELGGKLLPSVLEIVPEEDPGNMTIIEQLWIEFDKPIKEQFFSVQSLKRVR